MLLLKLEVNSTADLAAMLYNAKIKADYLRPTATESNENFKEYNYWQDTVRKAIQEEICKRTVIIIPREDVPRPNTNVEIPM